MAKHALSFLALHDHFFMQGSNLGDKINAAQKNAKLCLDDERQVVWVYFKDKVSFIPTATVASADVIEIPEDIREFFGLTFAQADQAIPTAKKKPGRPAAQPVQESAPVRVPVPAFDPNDQDAAAKHRALVRAASANSNRSQPIYSSDDRLIQESRNAAMGIKTHNTAQVQTAQQVGQAASITGKPKPISHAALKAQEKA